MSRVEDPLGLVADSGLLYCIGCAEGRVNGQPVFGPPHSEEFCELCGRRLNSDTERDA